MSCGCYYFCIYVRAIKLKNTASTYWLLPKSTATVHPAYSFVYTFAVHALQYQRMLLLYCTHTYIHCMYVDLSVYWYCITHVQFTLGPYPYTMLLLKTNIQKLCSMYIIVYFVQQDQVLGIEPTIFEICMLYSPSKAIVLEFTLLLSRDWYWYIHILTSYHT